MGFPTPVLIIYQGVLFGRQEYEKNLFQKVHRKCKYENEMARSTDMVNAGKRSRLYPFLNCDYLNIGKKCKICAKISQLLSVPFWGGRHGKK